MRSLAEIKKAAEQAEVEQDFKKAAELYEQAANQGHAGAQMHRTQASGTKIASENLMATGSAAAGSTSTTALFSAQSKAAASVSQTFAVSAQDTTGKETSPEASSQNGNGKQSI